MAKFKKHEMTMTEKIEEDQRLAEEAAAAEEAAGIKRKGYIASLTAKEKTQRVSFAVSPNTWRQFTAACEEYGMSNSSCLNFLINKFIRDAEKK